MRRTIRSKLIISYLLIVIVTLCLSGGLFYAMVKKSITQQALDELAREGQNFVEVLADGLQQPDLEVNGPFVIQRPPTLRLGLASRATSAYYLIVNVDEQRVLGTNMENVKRGDQFLLSLRKLQDQEDLQDVRELNGKEYLIYATNIPKMDNTVLVLVAPLEIVRSVIKDMVRTLAQVFLYTSVVVLVLGLWFSRSLTRPVSVLGEQMRRLAKRDFSPPPVVRTGDELEEVSRTFAGMVEELKHYDQAQRRFLQNASHELKTPLMAIQGYAEGIKDGIFQGEEAESGLDVIIKESTRVKKLVDELIYLSKLETLEDIYRPSVEELAEIVEDSVTRVHALALQKGVKVQLTHRDLAMVRVDRDKLMQALINLLSNGIRHAKSRVWLDMRREDGWLHLYIRDDGEGFTGDLEAIFERFYKGDKGDTGLGLAIVKAIIGKSCGLITARNHEGGGAEFQVQLPISK